MNTQNNMNEYQDPLNTQNGAPAKKKMSGSTVAATVVAIALVFCFGVIGGAICYGGYWVVRAIAKSRMPLVARIILSIVVGLIFLVLLIVFILFAAGLNAALN